MAFTYTAANLGSSGLSQVRRLIGDTSTATNEFQDAEITFFVNQEPNIFGAASLACESLAAKYATAVTKSVGDLRLTLSDKHKHFSELAARFRSQAEVKGSPRLYAGGISEADKLTQEQDSDRVEPAFYREQFDYPGSVETST